MCLIIKNIKYSIMSRTINLKKIYSFLIKLINKNEELIDESVLNKKSIKLDLGSFIIVLKSLIF